MSSRISRRLACAFAIGSFAAVFSTAHAADTYPSKPLRWVIATAAGGGSDAMARMIATQLSAQLGQNVVIDNRPGGASVIASENVIRSPADGYTLFSADLSLIHI